MQKTQTAKNEPKAKVGTSFQKEVKVPLKLMTDRETEIKFVNGVGPLKEAFTVLMCTGQVTRQYTFHHPIGITALKSDDWVLTPTGEITMLLARQEDPSRARLDEARLKERLELAVNSKFLTKIAGNPDEYHYAGTKNDRHKALDVARKLAKQDKERSEKSKDNKMSVEIVAGYPDFDPIHYLDKENAKMEGLIRAYWGQDDTKKYLDKKFESLYQTCSGPMANVKQKSCVAVGFGPISPQKMQDLFMQRLINRPFGPAIADEEVKIAGVDPGKDKTTKPAPIS
jgi:hypothetical protein